MRAGLQQPLRGRLDVERRDQGIPTAPAREPALTTVPGASPAAVPTTS